MSQPAVAALAPLPFELVYSDGRPLESDWHVQQLSLFREAIYRAMEEQGQADFYVGTDMFVYYSVEQAREVWREEKEDVPHRAFRGPDVFWVGGVSRHMRKAWVAWEEGNRLPDVIIELLSPSTAKTDRTTKKDLYEQVFGTGEYFLVDPEARRVEGFDLIDGIYREKKPTAQGRLWCRQLEAYVGFWHGLWMKAEADWARLFRRDGSLLPTETEAEHERAEAEHERAEAERERAEAAEAELARLRALLDGRARD
jgi:Uma2 family endonuclease